MSGMPSFNDPEGVKPPENISAEALRSYYQGLIAAIKSLDIQAPSLSHKHEIPSLSYENEIPEVSEHYNLHNATPVSYYSDIGMGYESMIELEESMPEETYSKMELEKPKMELDLTPTTLGSLVNSIKTYKGLEQPTTSPPGTNIFKGLIEQAAKKAPFISAEEPSDPVTALPPAKISLTPPADLTKTSQLRELESIHTISERGLYERGWVRDAPTIAGLLADKEGMKRREHQLVFSNRTDKESGRHAVTTRKDADGHEYIEAEKVVPLLDEYSEADTLYDFHLKMLQAEAVLEGALDNNDGPLNSALRGKIQVALEASQQMRNELRYIGPEELSEACETYAAYWFSHLESGKNLNLVVAEAGSAPYIASLILEKLYAKYDPEHTYEDRIRLLDLRSNEHKEYLKNALANPLSRKAFLKDGLRLVDDWTISGSQMSSLVSVLIGRRVPPSAMEINLICATSLALTDGIGGVNVKGYYKRPTPADYHRYASIAGAHGQTDYGFTSILKETIYPYVWRQEGYERLPLPILASIAKVYKSHDYQKSAILDIGGIPTLHQRSAQYAAFVSANSLSMTDL